MKVLLITTFLTFIALSVQSARIGHARYDYEPWTCDFIDINEKVDNQLKLHSDGMYYWQCELLFKSMLNSVNKSTDNKWAGKNWQPSSSEKATVRDHGEGLYEFEGVLYSRTHTADGFGFFYLKNIHSFWFSRTRDLVVL